MAIAAGIAVFVAGIFIGVLAAIQFLMSSMRWDP